MWIVSATTKSVLVFACVCLGSELSSDALLILDCVVSVLLPLIRYVNTDSENSHEVIIIIIIITTAIPKDLNIGAALQCCPT